ncbi:MAG TPA: DNA-binding protein [Dehalococcoidia bacterium]|nr:DNA-binding protein [Dehalococcoidia bacterium]
MAQSTNQNARTAHLLAQLETEIRDAFAKGVPLGDIQELVSTIVVDEQRDDTQREVPNYDEIPPGLVTSEEAAKKYGISTSTIRTWVDSGHLALEA